MYTRHNHVTYHPMPCVIMMRQHVTYHPIVVMYTRHNHVTYHPMYCVTGCGFMYHDEVCPNCGCTTTFGAHCSVCVFMYNLELCPNCGGTTTFGAHYTLHRLQDHVQHWTVPQMWRYHHSWGILHRLQVHHTFIDTSNVPPAMQSLITCINHVTYHHIYIYASLYHSLMSITSYMYVYVS